MKRILYIMFMLACVTAINAQSDRQYVREGNRLYRKAQYAKAETAYRKALEVNNRNPQAAYNLGCALMKQNNDSMAIQQFADAAQLQADKKHKAMAYHNIGVVCQQKKDFSSAIDAYKQALRLNPSDNDTRYNLALCKRQQQKQQNQSGGGKDDKNQQKDNKDKKNDKKDEKNKDQNKDKDKQEQQQDKSMSRDNAEQLLNAAMQQEKQIQERLKANMQQPRRRKLNKNW